jgi:hypothetical protein
MTNKKTEQDFADAAHQSSLAWARLKTPELGKGDLAKIGWTDEARAAAMESKSQHHKYMARVHDDMRHQQGMENPGLSAHADAREAHTEAAKNYDSAAHKFRWADATEGGKEAAENEMQGAHNMAAKAYQASARAMKYT